MPVLMLEMWRLELFLITYFNAFTKDGVVHLQTKVFTARHLDGDTGEGLFVSQGAVEYMNVEDWRTKMISLAVKSFPDNGYFCIASSVS